MKLKSINEWIDTVNESYDMEYVSVTVDKKNIVDVKKILTDNLYNFELDNNTFEFDVDKANKKSLIKELEALMKLNKISAKINEWVDTVDEEAITLKHKGWANESNVQESKEYKDFFNAALKKFGATDGPDSLSDEKKKEFFDYVDKNWKAKNETD